MKKEEKQAKPAAGAAEFYIDPAGEVCEDEQRELVQELLDEMEESDPGFCERVSAVHNAENRLEAVRNLTLRDITAHTILWHKDPRALEAVADNLDADILGMIKALSKEWKVCTSCVRAAMAGLIARTMAWDLGPHATPDPLAMPKSVPAAVTPDSKMMD